MKKHLRNGKKESTNSRKHTPRATFKDAAKKELVVDGFTFKKADSAWECVAEKCEVYVNLETSNNDDCVRVAKHHPAMHKHHDNKHSFKHT